MPQAARCAIRVSSSTMRSGPIWKRVSRSIPSSFRYLSAGSIWRTRTSRGSLSPSSTAKKMGVRTKRGTMRVSKRIRRRMMRITINRAADVVHLVSRLCVFFLGLYLAASSVFSTGQVSCVYVRVRCIGWMASQNEHGIGVFGSMLVRRSGMDGILENDKRR